MKFVTKQAEVDAEQFMGTPSSAGEIAEWLGATEFRWDSKPVDGGKHVAVWVLDFAGSIQAKTDEWIVRQGSEFFVFSVAEFVEHFEEPPVV